MKSNPPSSGQFTHLRLDAAAIADARGVLAAPASLLLRLDENVTRSDDGVYVGSHTVVAAGRRAVVDDHPSSGGAERIDLPDAVLLPGLVNAHTHLDLTHIGPRNRDADAGFLSFIDVVRQARVTDEAALRASVRRGMEMLLAGGVTAVGDIAGAPMGRPTLVPYETLKQGFTLGTSYLEFFAMGFGEQPARTRLLEFMAKNRQILHTGDGVRFGLQPHAPTTVARQTFDWVADHPDWAGLPLATHLGETPEEHEFIAHGGGPQRVFLESLGLWQDAMLEHIGQGGSPIEHLGPVLSPRFLCAHVNDCSNGDLDLLARSGAHVVYCPRASAYFGVERAFGPHRYRDMLARGINVCLGTDSIINLPAGTDRLSTLDEARFLYRRDGGDPVALLGMATTRGAGALGMASHAFSFEVGRAVPIAGVLAVPLDGSGWGDPLEAVMSGDSRPQLIVCPGVKRGTGTAPRA